MNICIYFILPKFNSSRKNVCGFDRHKVSPPTQTQQYIQLVISPFTSQTTFSREQVWNKHYNTTDIVREANDQNRKRKEKAELWNKREGTRGNNVVSSKPSSQDTIHIALSMSCYQACQFIASCSVSARVSPRQFQNTVCSMWADEVSHRPRWDTSLRCGHFTDMNFQSGLHSKDHHAYPDMNLHSCFHWLLSLEKAIKAVERYLMPQNYVEREVSTVTSLWQI